MISVRRALRGNDLARLRDAVEQEFLTLDAQEEEMRTAMARLETGFLRRFATLQGIARHESGPEARATRPGPRASPTLADQVGAKASRKLKARRSGTPGVWFGLGMMGLIGWSVAVPTLLGAGLGLWLDQTLSRWALVDAGAAGGGAVPSAA